MLSLIESLDVPKRKECRLPDSRREERWDIVREPRYPGVASAENLALTVLGLTKISSDLQRHVCTANKEISR